MSRRLLVIGIVLLDASLVRAADGARLIHEKRATAQRLAEAAQLERDGRGPAALDLFLRVLEENPADLVPMDASGEHWRPARCAVHRHIAASAELLPLYRARTDEAARKLFAAAMAARDPALIEQLTQRYFCAGPTEDALHALGDYACERGRFADARAWWSQLTPNDGYPQPRGDPALPHAKIIVSRILAREAGADEIAAFARLHPTAAGHLAGRKGPFHETLATLAAQPGAVVAGRETDSQPWPEFEPVEHCPPILLPGAAAVQTNRVVQRAPVGAHGLAIHPAIVAGHALVADARRLSAYNLSTGTLIAQFDLKSVVAALPLDLDLPSASRVQYRVTVSGDDVYVRLGQPRIMASRNESTSAVVALRFRPAESEKLQLRWVLTAAQQRDIDDVFEGAPAVNNGRLFVAATRLKGNRAITKIACYDPTGTPAQLIWESDILEAPADTADRTWHLPLAIAGSHMICGPHAGLVVALDAAIGQPAWAHRYPATETARRAPEPVVEHDGRIIVAPNDHDRILALDAATGAAIWKSDPIEASQILGVLGSSVIVQTGGFVSGLRAIDVATGRLNPHWGYAGFGTEATSPWGRGLILGDRVCWPTRVAGLLMARSDGRAELAPAVFHGLPGGNMAFADGFLVLAGVDRLNVLMARPRQQVTIPTE